MASHIYEYMKSCEDVVQENGSCGLAMVSFFILNGRKMEGESNGSVSVFVLWRSDHARNI